VFVGSSEDYKDELPWIFDRLQSINLPENDANEEQLRRLANVLKNAA